MSFRTIFSNSLFAVVIFTLTLTGCAFQIHHLPTGQPVNPLNIKEFTSTKTFQVQNNQPSSEKLIIGSCYLGSFFTSLSEFSEVAAELLRSELTQRGMISSMEAEKVLKLAVTDIQLVEVGFRWKCTVSMDVETGAGYKTIYNVNNLTPSNTRVCGGAITLAVTEMLNDPNIIDYLTEMGNN